MSLWLQCNCHCQTVSRMMPGAGVVAMTAIPVRHAITVLTAFCSRLHGRRALLPVVAIVHTVVVPIVVPDGTAMVLHSIILSLRVIAIVVADRTAGDS